MVYTWYIPGISCPTVNHAFCVLSSSCPENPCLVHVFPIHPVLIASLKPCKTKGSLKLVYVTYIPCIYNVIHGICHVYTRYVWYIDLKANYSFLYISGFNIILSSTMTLVCRIDLRINTWKRNFDIHCIYVVYAIHILPPYIYMEYT